MIKRKAFTLLEIVMVIVILGIVASIGTSIISNMYEGYIRSKTINEIQQKTELAIDQIAKRLQYRIKETLIARIEGSNSILSLSDANIDENYNMIEWIGYDNEGFKGDWNGSMTVPGWSGFIDLNNTLTDENQTLTSGSDLSIAENTIFHLSYDDVNLSDPTNDYPAIIFKCPKPDENLTKYGWDHTNTTDHNYTLRVRRNGTNILQFVEDTASKELCEQYWLAWSAYALVLVANPNVANDFNLTLHYNYQPWHGERYDINTTSSVIAEHVSTFRVTQVGDSVRIKLCIQDVGVTGEAFGFCKEKAIW